MAQGTNMATAADSQGIMALPTGGAPVDTGAPAQPQLGLDDSYDAVQQGLQNASPDAHTAVNAELAQLAPQLDQLPDEVLDQLLQIVQYMHDNPKEYAQLLKDLVDEGIIDQGDFPEEYDPEFLATLGMVIMQARKTRQGAQQGAMPIQEAPVPPANMARGGIAEAAHMVASRGRGQDTMLAHITPQEARMLRSKGGMGTINPATGLPEYGFFKSITRAVSGAVKSVAGNIKDAVKSVTGAVKSIVSSPIGKIVATVALATFIGPAAFGLSGAAGVAAQMALASGAVTALGGGNMKDVLKSAAIGGATAFFGAPGGAVSNFVGGAVTNAAANAAITSGIVGTGIGLLSGQKLQDAVKSGITAGAISGLSTGARNKGFDAQIDAPKLETVADMAKNQAGQDVSGNAGTADLKPVMDPATGDVRTVVADNNQVYKVYTRPDGSAVYQPATGTGANAPAFMKGDVIRPDLSSSSASNTGTNANAGAFMKGDAPRVVVSSSAPTPAQGYQTPPTIGQSLKTMGGGISDIAQGDFSKGFEGLSKGAGDLFFPEGPTADQVRNSSAFTKASAAGADYNTAYQKGAEALGAPGMLRSYGPMVGAGLGIASLGGAFTPKPPEPTQLQNDINQRLADEKARVAANPGDYVPKGLERFGIKYNERGEIIGSEPFNPAPPPGSTEVAGNYMPYTPSPYMTPSGAIGGSQPIYQPYNTASMYTNLMPPQYRADGGMMDAEPMHYGFGGDVVKIIRRIKDEGKFPVANRPPQGGALSPLSGFLQGSGTAQPVVQSGNYSATAYMPEPSAPAPQAPQALSKFVGAPPPMPADLERMPTDNKNYQPPAQLPTEFTQYQQPYDANQISDLSRRLYPSIYDRDYRNSIMSNTAMGNSGGIASLAKGGYPRRTGQISGPGTATSDSIPAMLSDGEFVMTAKAVRGAGKGSRLAGAKKMYALMHQLERNAARG
jgi:hypothetical protein